MYYTQCTAGKVIPEGSYDTDDFLWQLLSMIPEAMEAIYIVALVSEGV